jgi:UPF0114 protein CGSHiEE_00455
MEHQKPQDPYAKYNSQSNQLSKIIFASRWLQLPIYLGLIVVQSIYAYKFMKSLWYLNRQYQRNGFQHYYAYGIEFN